MPKRAWNDWAEVFWHYVAKGYDRSWARYMADNWEKRKLKAKAKA